jgi:hypothetical protein
LRKSTLLWLLLATFCGIALFHTSQRVHDSGEKLAALSQDVAREEESIRVLQTEWSYLNQPARLEKLTKQYLKLVPMKGAQFTKANDIALRSEAPPAPVAEAPKTTKHPALLASVPSLPLEGGKDESAVKPAPAKKPRTASRKFGDVMKSLGVEQ